MAHHLVAVVGRPNVGKSTFVNRIAGTGDAIVHEMRGVTRDRSYHEADWNGCDFTLIDTGGIEMGEEDAFQASIREQAFEGARECDVIIFLVDGQTGINADDEEVARILRKGATPLAVNKMDNPADQSAIYEFYSLGLGDPWPISSTHGIGTGDLLDALVEELDRIPLRESSEGDEINVAIIGRPNAGKSSLTNMLSGEDRSIVSDVSGTTRDAIDTVVHHEGKAYRLVDTAGLRRKSQIDHSVEYYGFVRSMRAIDRAEVALLMIDGTLGVTDQDQRVAGFAAERGCALVVVLNKWDAVEGGPEKERIREQVEEKLHFVGYAPVVAVSALTGKNTQKIWAHIDASFESYNRRVPTNALNTWLTDVRDFGHTVTQGKKLLKLKFVTQTSVRPPQFTFFVNHPELVSDQYERYLEGRLRRQFAFSGTPVRMKFKRRD